ncbi:hypothetical protein, partial [Enterococcus faecalis]
MELKGKKTKKAVVVTATASLMANGLLGAGVAFADEQKQEGEPNETRSSQMISTPLDLNSPMSDTVSDGKSGRYLDKPIIDGGEIYEGEPVTGSTDPRATMVYIAEKNINEPRATKARVAGGRFSLEHNYKAGESVVVTTTGSMMGNPTDQIIVKPKRQEQTTKPVVTAPLYKDGILTGTAEPNAEVYISGNNNAGWQTVYADENGNFEWKNLYAFINWNVVGHKLLVRAYVPGKTISENVEVTVQEKPQEQT